MQEQKSWIEKRIWFEKRGIVRFISHLDLMRTMTKIAERSDVPLWYTEGFNPRPYVTFALPLSLGMESLNDCMDIRLERDMPNKEILKAFKAVLPPLITVTGVTDPVHKTKEIAEAKFEITFSMFDDTEKLAQLMKQMLSQDELIVQKPGKKGRKKVLKDIDLIPYIKHYGIHQEGNVVVLSILLPAGGETNINPMLLCDEIKKQSADENGMYIVRRTGLITKDGEDFA